MIATWKSLCSQLRSYKFTDNYLIEFKLGITDSALSVFDMYVLQGRPLFALITKRYRIPSY